MVTSSALGNVCGRFCRAALLGKRLWGAVGFGIVCGLVYAISLEGAQDKSSDKGDISSMLCVGCSVGCMPTLASLLVQLSYPCWFLEHVIYVL